MPLRISRKIRDNLPTKDEQDQIDILLRQKAGCPSGDDKGGNCALCTLPLNWSDPLVADHNTPLEKGGKNCIANLHIACSRCNSAKQDNLTLDVRPYLKLREITRREGRPLLYDEVLEKVYEINSATCSISWNKSNSEVTFYFKAPGNNNSDPLRQQTVSVFEETTHHASYSDEEPITFHAAYVAAPVEALCQDSKVQPRSIKPTHAFAIFKDLANNPLHEAPACRLEKSPSNSTNRLLMFDGQHKVIANLMAQRDWVVTKVYLDMKREQAEYLVNSIQSEAVKLPLTKLELAYKLSEEFETAFSIYKQKVPDSEKSEAAYVASLPSNRRGRGKREVQSAIIARVTKTTPKLPFLGTDGKTVSGITEAFYQNKMIKPVAAFDPLHDTGRTLQVRRRREANNIALLLREYWRICIAPGRSSGVHNEIQRSDRMIKQSVTAHFLPMVRDAVAYNQGVHDEALAETFLLDHTIEGAVKEELEKALNNLANHPIWYWNLEPSTKKLRAVQDAISKNQGAKEAFNAIGLDKSYIMGAKTDLDLLFSS